MKRLIYSVMIPLLFSCGGSTEETKESAKITNDKIGNETQSSKTGNWDYYENEDEMDNSKRYFAYTVSKNKLEFEFPYNGGSELILTLRKGKDGTDVILRIDKGQFMGGLFGNEVIRVKFDDNKPINFTYSSPDTGSSEVIFINNEKKFISLLKTAKKVKIEPMFFDVGSMIVDFDVDGLEWE